MKFETAYSNVEKNIICYKSPSAREPKETGNWAIESMYGDIVDNLVVLFSLLFNIVMILVFVFRGQRRTQSEARLGPLSNLLLVPFSISGC